MKHSTHQFPQSPRHETLLFLRIFARTCLPACHSESHEREHPTAVGAAALMN